jgi:branched-chain amino acid transport system permease protein
LEALLTALVIGLANGLIIALIAIGYTLVYGILELINFAHGDVFMLGTAFTFFATTFIVDSMGIDPASSTALLLTFLALPFVMLACAAINASIERLAYRPLRNAPRLAPLISAIGVSFVLLNVGLILLGPSPRAVPPILPKEDLLGGLIGTQHVFVAVITIPLLIVLRWFVANTRQGKAMRATAQDREASGLMGIDVNRTISLTFLIAGALAGAAGVVVALYYGQTRFEFGFQFGLYAFTAAVLGGIGNLTGATVGGMTIGLILAMSDRFLEARWTSVIVFSILIIVLIFRPTGLFAEKQSERA